MSKGSQEADFSMLAHAMQGGRMTRRRFLCHAAALGVSASALGSFLAACGGGGAASDGETSSALKMAEIGKATGAVSIMGWDLGDQDSPQGKSFVARRRAWEEANPGANLEFDPVPYDSFLTTVTTRARAGRLSDTLEMIPGASMQAVFPVLASLNPELFGAYDLQALQMWEYTTVAADNSKGHAGVPVGGQGTMWYYNKALFEKAGLDPEVVPETWDDLKEVVAQLKAAGITPVTMSRGAFHPFFMYAGLLAQFFPAATDIQSFRAGEIAMTDDRFVEPLQALADAGKDGWFIDGFLDKQDADSEADFASGRTALVPGWIGGMMNWAVWDQKLGKDAYGVFLTPMHSNGKERAVYSTPDLMFGMSKSSSNPETALSWLGFLGSKEGVSLHFKIAGSLPNRSDIDLAKLTDSPGCLAIADLYGKGPLVETPLDFLSSSAVSAVFQKLGATFASGDVMPFLEEIETLNRQA